MPPSIITLGTFDGVHRGHQSLLAKVVSRAKARKARSVVLAFGMPPRHTGEKLAKPVLLTTLAEKRQLLKRLGIDRVEILTFDRKTASTSPEDFFTKTLLGKFKAVEMVVGPRVAFGKKRAGRLPLLRQLGREHRVRIHVVSSVNGGDASVSSRRIRAFLESGQVDKAERLLGYPYSVEGPVVHGDRRGRRLGFPTANIATEPGKILPPGVFWVKVLPASIGIPFNRADLRKAADGLCNVGTRPTFASADHSVHCEVFLLKGAERLYGKKLRVIFLRRIRPEKRFQSGDELRHQIAQDLALARRWIKGK